MGSAAFLLLVFLPVSGFAAAEPSRCDQIRAEFKEMERLTPRACAESREVHARYQKSWLEVNEHCRRLEARVASGPVRLRIGTEDEMQYEAMEQKRKDLEERNTLTHKLAHELLLTPIDTDSPARPPAQVTDACRDELDDYAKIRRVVLTAFNRFFTQIDQHDDTLFTQASERALPRGTRPASVKPPGER